jgi:hypothetical protein
LGLNVFDCEILGLDEMIKSSEKSSNKLLEIRIKLRLQGRLHFSQKEQSSDVVDLQ